MLFSNVAVLRTLQAISVTCEKLSVRARNLPMPGVWHACMTNRFLHSIGHKRLFTAMDQTSNDTFDTMFRKDTLQERHQRKLSPFVLQSAMFLDQARGSFGIIFIMSGAVTNG